MLQSHSLHAATVYFGLSSLYTEIIIISLNMHELVQTLCILKDNEIRKCYQLLCCFPPNFHTDCGGNSGGYLFSH